MDTPDFFGCEGSARFAVGTQQRRDERRQAHRRRAGRQRRCDAMCAPRGQSHTKGGIKRMAKKTAKGGKKKGGKKR